MIRGWMCLLALTVAAGAGGAGVGCSSSGNAPPSTFLPRGEMIQPAKCATCHQSHFDDWTESMHAQAADDPVFIAMNKRGQRETKGALGTFCVKCHAPMAVRDGLTTDGLNLASLPTYYKGVTCFFCHSIDSVGADHDNASVNLSDDLVMRGEYSDPVANPAHASAYSTLHDDQQKASATMCGSCHDIDSPAGGHIERTFAEWSASAFSGTKGSSCSFSGCHMTADPVLVPIATGGPKRKFHPHNFPAVDVSLETSAEQATSGPGTLAEGGEAADGTPPTEAGGAAEGGEPTDAGASADGASAADAASPAVGDAASGASSAEAGLPGTVAVQTALNSNALAAALCFTAQGGIRVILDTAGIGHQWPSGAAQDRRAWAEVIAYSGDGTPIYSSGVVPDGTPVTSTSIKDPDLWLLRDCMYDAQNQPVVNFWQAANHTGYELPALSTFDRADPAFFANHIVQSFPRANGPSPALSKRPARITLRIRIQPVGLDVLNDLVASQDLDPAVVGKMPTFDVSLQGPGGDGLPPPGGLEWTPASNDATYVDSDGVPSTCAASPGFNPGQPYPGGSAAICTPPTN